ncbi:MAG: hypothetical protein OEQ29_17115 [Alphaproteobacteria bacterium]|nr:hypothetical protein [Alphaproteobacteria bacterium]
MRIVKMSVLAAAVLALSAPAYAGGAGGGCGGYKSAKTAQTTVTKSGPQTTVKQTASSTQK